MISVITPLHKFDTAFIKEAYQSLKDQTFKDWEWIILLNGEAVGHYGVQGTSGPGAPIMQAYAYERYDSTKLFGQDDKRIQIHIAPLPSKGNIGALKQQACVCAKGDILVELDSDDLLTENCLQEIYNAFISSDIHMVYSNSCGFENDTWKPAEVYSADYGWKSRPFIFKGHKLIEMIAWPPSAQMMRRIDWAPNHVRAWRTSSYLEIGGHDSTIAIGDDHDLCCRYYIKYGEKGIHHIDKTLYLYRVHGNNSCYADNKSVQEQTDKNYCKYSRQMAERWAKDNNLRMIDLGGRFDCPTGYESVDLSDADVICDLNGKWNFKDGSVGIIRASHVLEHLENPIHVMNEAYRVLAGGGFFFIDVPSTDGRGAFQDPTHRNCFWNSNSFFYYTRDSHAKYIRGKHLKPEYTGRFQKSRIINWFPNEFMKEHDILCVQADLICLKAPYADRPCGEVLI